VLARWVGFDAADGNDVATTRCCNVVIKAYELSCNDAGGDTYSPGNAGRLRSALV
jgi:hypothetical protein